MKCHFLVVWMNFGTLHVLHHRLSWQCAVSKTYCGEESISPDGHIDLLVAGLRVVHDATELLNEELERTSQVAN